jgi:peptide/nickel transport system substrate-binding protein
MGHSSAARAQLPVIYHTRLATCMQPQLKGLIVMVNSQYNGWRMEDVWLDR